mgnify:CR=1 FL=1
MAKNVLKKIVKILSAVNYVLLCVYAAMFCAYRAFDSFQSLVFYTLLQTFLNDDGVLAYLIISLPLGVIGCIILAVFSRKRKVPAAILLLSLVLQFIPLVTCFRSDEVYPKHVFPDAVYALGTAAFIASAAFAIYLLCSKPSPRIDERTGLQIV